MGGVVGIRLNEDEERELRARLGVAEGPLGPAAKGALMEGSERGDPEGLRKALAEAHAKITALEEDKEQLSAAVRQGLPATVGTARHMPRPGRIARVCTHKDCVPPMRKFGDREWVCPEHGGRYTVDQPNNKYFGQPVPEVPAT